MSSSAVALQEQLTFIAEDDTDAELISRIAAGNQTAFDQLYQRYVRRTFSLALRILKEPNEAEELVQDLFVRLWEKAHNYKSDLGTVSTWILTITHRLCIDRLRSKARRPIAMGYEENTLALTNQIVSDSDPYEETWIILKREKTQLALSHLSTDQREVLYLAYFEGLSHTEIALKLGEPLGTIKGRIRRSMLNLRSNLEMQPEAFR